MGSPSPKGTRGNCACRARMLAAGPPSASPCRSFSPEAARAAGMWVFGFSGRQHCGSGSTGSNSRRQGRISSSTISASRKTSCRPRFRPLFVWEPPAALLHGCGGCPAHPGEDCGNAHAGPWTFVRCSFPRPLVRPPTRSDLTTRSTLSRSSPASLSTSVSTPPHPPGHGPGSACRCSVRRVPGAMDRIPLTGCGWGSRVRSHQSCYRRPLISRGAVSRAVDKLPSKIAPCPTSRPELQVLLIATGKAPVCSPAVKRVEQASARRGTITGRLIGALMMMNLCRPKTLPSPSCL